MIAKPLFRRHYFISVAVIVAGLVMSFFAAHLIASYERERERQRDRDRFPLHPARYFSRLVPLLQGHTPEDAVRLLNPENPRELPFRFSHLATDSQEIGDLSAEQREALGRGEVVEVQGGDGAFPSGFISLGEGRGYLKATGTRMGPGGGGPPVTMGADGRPASGPPRGPPGGPPGGPGGGRPFLLITLACLFVGVIITTGVAISLLFSSYRQRAETAAGVLQELKSGNLSARMPTQKMDELSDLVTSFNLMADEIEKLVNRIKSSEANRTQALQKLAHDLRTPLASMKNLLETLKEDRERMTEDQVQRSIELSLAEETYFERLVEDLLVLASLSGTTHASPEQVALTDLLQDAVEVTQMRFPDIKIELRAGDEDGLVRGDRRMLERMLRNGIENAMAFAKTKVQVRLEKTASGIEVRIDDDGPGLSDADLQSFGKPRATRRINATQGMRVSSGLGSLIMKEVAHLHGGEATIANRRDGERVSGAELTIKLGSA